MKNEVHDYPTYSLTLSMFVAESALSVVVWVEETAVRLQAAYHRWQHAR